MNVDVLEAGEADFVQTRAPEDFSALIAVTNVTVTTMPPVIQWMAGASAQLATQDCTAKISARKAIGAKTATRLVNARTTISFVIQSTAAFAGRDSQEKIAICIQPLEATRFPGMDSTFTTTTELHL